MGAATRLGPFGSFSAVWIAMMAAMMLPGAYPAMVRRTPRRLALAAPAFAVQYLALWAAMGCILYALYRPHGVVAAGTIVIAAGVYELTPIKRRFRQRCLESTGSGLAFGLNCVGSSVGLMAVLAAVGPMSTGWMVVVGVIVSGQKLMTARPSVDAALGLALTGLGVVILIAPSIVPGLVRMH